MGWQAWGRLCITALLLTATGLACAQHSGKALLLDVEGTISPATSDYIVRNLERAAREDAQLVVLRLDTPGGLDSAMRQIIRNILDSSVPVVTFVAPSGARAASAGTYILYASHFAGMAPATTLGAATPVQIATPMAPAAPKHATQPQETPEAADPMQHKMVNDAVAYIRGLAQLRARNADWAERAVREAATLTADEARAQQVIDVVANDVADLLKQLDGRKITLLGQERTLDTTGLTLQHSEPDWRSRLLAVIGDPNVAYILMMIGIYGLIYELANPGVGLPGVAGAVCLLLALFAFQVLPINYAGLALIFVGIAFMVAEVFVPSFGALGIGGVIAFVFGSVILLDTDVPGYRVAWPLIAMFALTSAAFFLFVISMMMRARKQPVVSGAEELPGSTGEALEDFTERGRVRVHSESWTARTRTPLHKGDAVRVTGRTGLVLDVEPASGSAREISKEK
jgi:membrane-bound serine protease (ClpP class)